MLSLPFLPKTLSSRAHLVCGLCLLATFVASGSSILVRSRLIDSLDNSVVLTTAVRNHTTLDMYHDGLRAIVLSALTASELGTSEQDVKANLADMSADFAAIVAANKELPLATNIKQALESVDAPLASYLEKAQATVAIAFTDRQQALAAMPEFNARFEELEKSLEAVGQQIENEAKKINEGSKEFATTTAWITNAAIVFSISGVLMALVFMLRGILSPLAALETAMARLSQGHGIGVVPGADRADEIGSMSRSVGIFAHGIAENERLRVEHADAERKASEARRTARHNLAAEFEGTVGAIIEKVAAAVGSLEGIAKQLTRSADATKQLSTMVGTASEVTSGNVGSVATATEQLSAAVGEIERQISESAQAASHAVAKANASNTRVTELLAAATRVGDVIGLINSIASQTNLLALNATIEAARAGEAGKGFAVVAQEVKALATQTAKATSDIASQIQGMQSATQDAVDTIGGVVETIGKISDITNAISAAVAEQATATQDISHNVMEAAKGTSEVTANIGEVNESANETGNASSAVLSSTVTLSSESNALKAEVARFLATLRAA
ncbi:methyl-accepting chemotaxis protein [Hyphomicrobium sp.]|uniref:methyl-accepting chemotaxis protein n=1 Tax=Hyphomicrobium sp. TaxID=82 RepID=UPI002E33D1C3|nr:methyl-accepting chemotaxis protein [Hyphomicrobium sp.]HEX2842930.1 methyl-accepting chemotaxis protein [Hyphomicrobium sp.]